MDVSQAVPESTSTADRRNRLASEAGPRPGPGSEASSLDYYFTDISGASRLSAKEELASALALLRSRRELWEALLDGDASSSGVLAATLEAIPGDRVPEDALAGFLERRSSPRELATALVEADRDGIAASAALEALVDAARVADPDAPPRARQLRRCRRIARELKQTRDAFVTANLGLVVTLARRYERRHLGFADLIQEGNTGLIKAVDRFDPRRGFRFSTYAVWWIRHAIGRALSDKGREIRLPVHVAEHQQTLLRVRNAFERVHGRAPDVEELARASGLGRERVEHLLSVELQRAHTVDPHDRTSAPVDVEALPAPERALELALDRGRARRAVAEAMERLSPLQRDVLRRRYGLDGDEPMTLREIAEIHSLSRERIRQVQLRALDLVRRELRRRRLAAHRAERGQLRPT